MLFILWNAKRDGEPRRDDNGAIVSDGVLGRIGPDNCYLTAYPCFPDGRLPRDLAVGESIKGVRYRLSGETHFYDVYRVE